MCGFATTWKTFGNEGDISASELNARASEGVPDTFQNFDGGFDISRLRFIQSILVRQLSLVWISQSIIILSDD